MIKLPQIEISHLKINLCNPEKSIATKEPKNTLVMRKTWSLFMVSGRYLKNKFIEVLETLVM